MSRTNDVCAAVREIPLLSGLTGQQIIAIAARAERLVYDAGDVIVRDGAICDAAVVIVEGEAICTDGVANAVAEAIGPGAVLSEMAMVVDIEASSTVVARTRIKALRLNQTDIIDVLSNDRAMSECLIAEVSQRLREASEGLRAIEAELGDTAYNAPDGDVSSAAALPAQMPAAPAQTH